MRAASSGETPQALAANVTDCLPAGCYSGEVLRAFLILFTLVAMIDIAAFGGRGRIAVAGELRHFGYVVSQQDWKGFI